MSNDTNDGASSGGPDDERRDEHVSPGDPPASQHRRPGDATHEPDARFPDDEQVDDALRDYRDAHAEALSQKELSAPPMPEGLEDSILDAIARAPDPAARGAERRRHTAAPDHDTGASRSGRRSGPIVLTAAACFALLTAVAVALMAGRDQLARPQTVPDDAVLLAALGKRPTGTYADPRGIERCLDAAGVPAEPRAVLGTSEVDTEAGDAGVLLVATERPGTLLALVVRPGCLHGDTAGIVGRRTLRSGA
ncbi:hypothetical protein P0W64_09865 [Tsukamurella sp. 8F]|uniref:hypothetical protein n=1 Tax=unclassified Tsukamurella TaxID=2633480 RepID=UPI0023B9069C|nr:MULTISPECIES: hypothetical protein [unclassified Tsukamurella]MDF0529415.1 hypothetical protein [Tsukamurella sp. 8J]MDF0587078.1 hypothetical protein [Tsukamurella sp. 8F]